MASLVLKGRAGDSVVIQAAVTAAIAGVKLEIVVTAAPGGAADATAACLHGPEGLLLTRPTAISEYIASRAAAEGLAGTGADRYRVLEWAEWQESRLESALAAALAPATDTFTPMTEPLALAVAHVAASLAAGGLAAHVSRGALSLADIGLWSSLYAVLAPEAGPAVLSGPVPSPVAAWFARLAASTAARSGLAAALGGSPPTAARACAVARGALVAPRAPRLPVAGRRNVLITSALPYVNNVPHLGNLIGCVLSADVYARYGRSRGHNVVYVCGTDEYGTTSEAKAMAEGATPRAVCNKYHRLHAAIYSWFGVSFDAFGRTSTPQQAAVCGDVFGGLHTAGLLTEEPMEQLYDDEAERFLADRFVEGTCPRCGDHGARGDQCDACGALLNPSELIDPRSTLSGTAPRPVTTQHVFLDLPQLKPRLEAYVTTASHAGGWSANALMITNAWLRDGLKRRCITRDLKWGVPVPLPHMRDNKVLYVWFDAPIGYISITAAYTPDWGAWWKPPPGSPPVELVQFMGKDNVPFHTVIFPASLLGSAGGWTTMTSISTTEYLNYEAGKFSKSRGVGVFGNDAVATGIPPDVWRYYLLANRPEVSDSVFLWSDLAAKANGELLNNLGNFVNRALSFVASRYACALPDPAAAGDDPLPEVAELSARAVDALREYTAAMDAIRLKEGLKIAMALSRAGNAFLQSTAPWVAYKDAPARCGALVAAAVGLVLCLATTVGPFMPFTAASMLSQLGVAQAEALPLTDAGIARASRLDTLLPAGHVIGTPAVLFAAITPEQVADLSAKFAGTQAPEDAPPSAGAAKPRTAKGGPSQPKATPTGGGSAAPPAPAPSSSLPVDISRLDIRVGVITSVARHPGADTLYVEQVDVGEGAPRTVVSGLVKYMPESALNGRKVILVCNLKPTALRGVTSQAMVLAATSADGTRVELVDPPAGAVPGDRVAVAGYAGNADSQLNPKLKIFETVQPDLATTADCIAVYKGVALSTKGGPCTVASIAGGSIK